MVGVHKVEGVPQDNAISIQGLLQSATGGFFKLADLVPAGNVTDEWQKAVVDLDLIVSSQGSSSEDSE